MYSVVTCHIIGPSAGPPPCSPLSKSTCITLSSESANKHNVFRLHESPTLHSRLPATPFLCALLLHNASAHYPICIICAHSWHVRATVQIKLPFLRWNFQSTHVSTHLNSSLTRTLIHTLISYTLIDLYKLSYFVYQLPLHTQAKIYIIIRNSNNQTKVILRKKWTLSRQSKEWQF